MTTGAASASIRPASTATYDRRFYSTMAIVMALVVFAGFGPTFYLRSYFGGPVSVTGLVTITPVVLAHGLVFTAWVVLFVVQTGLIATRNVATHRRIGLAAVALAAAMVAVIPCLLLVVFFHRRIITGLTEGFVKG